jgi:hypothetical protein
MSLGPSGPAAEALRNEGLDAAATAIRLDPSNSEAFTYKSLLIDQSNLSAREALLKQALEARPLACGCEHHLYAAFLEEVGRNEEAIGEYRRSVDVLALNPRSQLGLHGTLLLAGRSEEAKKHFDAYLDLTAHEPSTSATARLYSAVMMGDARAGQRALRDPALQMPAPLKSAIGSAFAALQSNLPQAKSAAAAGLHALPPEMGRAMKIYLLGALGENAESLKRVEAAVAANRPYNRSQLFTPALAGARADPAFPGVAERLGLLSYWRASRTKPDFCSERGAPGICRII